MKANETNGIQKLLEHLKLTRFTVSHRPSVNRVDSGDMVPRWKQKYHRSVTPSFCQLQTCSETLIEMFNSFWCLWGQFVCRCYKQVFKEVAPSPLAVWAEKTGEIRAFLKGYCSCITGGAFIAMQIETASARKWLERSLRFSASEGN